MKKIIPGLTLALLAGTLAFGSIALPHSKKASKVSADGYESYIEMTTGFFTNWTDDAGNIEGKDGTFWGENYTFGAVSPFFRGESKEGWTGTLVSRTWVQKEKYIYFQYGGARDYDFNPGEEVFLRIHHGDTYTDFWNNTFMENTMMFRVFEIPNFDSYNGQDFNMYIEFIDRRTEGYGFNTFGNLHVNQTIETAGDSMRYYINNLQFDNRHYHGDYKNTIINHFNNNASLQAVLNGICPNANESFDSLESFQKHFLFDNAYAYECGDAHPDKVISDWYARPDDGTNMPFNRTGAGFFKGWFADGQGFIGGDNPRYRFVSRAFKLSGTGFISIKMSGGGASLHLIDADTNTDLAWVDCRTFNSSGDINIIATGFNTVTMVKHVINFNHFLGRNVRVAIADVSSGGWGAAYFDELVTYYPNELSLGVEFVRQESNSGVSYATYRDVFVNAQHIDVDASGVKYVDGELRPSDTTATYEEYKFLNQYFDGFRNSSDFFNVCKESAAGDLISAYNSLSGAARALVDSATDFTYGETAAERVGDWYRIQPAVSSQGTVGNMVKYLGARYGVGVVGAAASLKMLANQEYSAQAFSIMVMIAAFISLTVAFSMIKRRRKIR